MFRFLFVSVFVPFFLFAQLDLSSFKGGCYGDFSSDQPPVIQDVKIKQEEGGALLVEATVFNDPEKTAEQTKEVFLTYSVDEGKSWEKIALEPVSGEEIPRHWTGHIPAQVSGTTVTFYLSAQDTAGNIATEVPGKVAFWPPSEGKELSGFPSGLEDEVCDSMREAEFDLLQLKYGYDDEYIYGMLQVRGKFQSGSLNPPHINGYITGVIPASLGVVELFDIISEAVGSQGLPEGAVLLWAPLLKDIGGAAMGITEEAALINASSAKVLPPFLPAHETRLETVAQGDKLYFRFHRSVVGKAGVWKSAAVGLYVTCSDLGSFLKSKNFLSCLGTDLDLALYLTTYFRTHTFQVP